MPPLYHLSPRVVPANQTSVITIRGLFPHTDFRRLKGSLAIDAIAADGLLLDGRLPGITMGNGYDLQRPNFTPLEGDLDAATGTLRVKLFFRGEGEHSIRVLSDGKPVAIFHLYSLNEDFLGLRPFRGDMHLHSHFSGCNHDHASPEYFAAASCAKGLDFISISDHKQLAPSHLAMAFADKCGGRLRAYPGEEVHLHDLHNLHFLNFGGRECVSAFLKQNPEQFAAEIAPFYRDFPDDGSDERVRQLCVSCDYLLHKINEFGGLSVLCHPYWKPHERFFLPTPVLEYMGRKLNFDALELLGLGNIAEIHREMNQLSISFWHDICVRAGRPVPVVGNTDAHGCEGIGLNCSIVFAAANTLEGIITAVRSNRSVAVERVPGEFPAAFGDRRLVAFAYYLRREYFPAHDDICRAQGALMFDAITTGAVNHEAMAALNSKMKQLDNDFWQA